MAVILSFDLQADFGFLKKPDVNDGLQLSYNMLHKPVLLGLLGAIAGLEGYQKQGVLPEYYQKLAALPVGIQPLEGYHEQGNFDKTVLLYTNTVGYANEDGNLIVREHTLIRPAYRCYLQLEPEQVPEHQLLYDRIRAGQAHYLPYLGKNEFHAWWDPESVKLYQGTPFSPKAPFRVDSLFVRTYPLRDHRKEAEFDINTLSLIDDASFAYFERLPLRFREEPGFIQYELAEFAYTDWVLEPSARIDDLYQLQEEDSDNQVIIQFY